MDALRNCLLDLNRCRLDGKKPFERILRYQFQEKGAEID
jgi:hypothetical protein